MSNHNNREELRERLTEAQASPEDLVCLLDHIAECDSCREAYEKSLRAIDLTLDSRALVPDSLENRDLYLKRFLDRARAQGLRFSTDLEKEEPIPVRMYLPLWRRRYVLGLVTLVLIIILGVGAYRRELSETRTAAELDELRVNKSRSAAELDELRTTNLRLGRLNEQLGRKLNLAEGQAKAAENKSSGLGTYVASDRRALSEAGARISNLQLQLNQAEAEILSYTEKAGEQQALNARLQRETQSASEFSDEVQRLQLLDHAREHKLAALNGQIDQLTAELKDQRELLGHEESLLNADRDVRALMGARNLHIVDIRDTDAQGKSAQAFGRVFYTEGKSLIFYAFDLADPAEGNARDQFVGWGAYSNSRNPLRALGVFYFDDATQRRWVLKVDDPVALKQIDAVFVTIRPGWQRANRPIGRKFLYAYLNSPANHP